jgi:hypothetical protein
MIGPKVFLLALLIAAMAAAGVLEALDLFGLHP